jgi:hypothetical protein
VNRNSAFFGDGGGGLTEPSNLQVAPQHDVQMNRQGYIDELIRWAKKNPKLADWDMLKGGQAEKRLQDEIGDSEQGRDTDPFEEGRIRQAQPKNGDGERLELPTNSKVMPARSGEDIDEYGEQAERMTRDMERNGALNPYGEFAHPQKRMAFVEELAERLRGAPARKPMPQGEHEEPSMTREAENKLWANTGELQKAWRAKHYKL